MRRRDLLKTVMLAVFLIGGLAYLRGVHAQQQQPKHAPAPGDGKSLVVQLCDGRTNLEVPGVAADGRLSPVEAQTVSDKLMRMWMDKQDPAVAAAWASEGAEQSDQQKNPSQKQESMKDDKPAPKQDTSRGPLTPVTEQIAPFSPRDNLIWDREVSKEVEYGNRLFHDDKLIGSTNGIACAMCHPNASNTHPETYPKFQIQLQRVALLRDMINWCIENPARGRTLASDDAKMRALEAYILWQRRGVAMAPGKH